MVGVIANVPGTHPSAGGTVTSNTNLANAGLNGFQITSTGWRNAGTGTNSDGSTAHIGVYGGAYAWPLANRELSPVTYQSNGNVGIGTIAPNYNCTHYTEYPFYRKSHYTEYSLHQTHRTDYY